MHKKERHAQVISMINSFPIASQGELASRLCEMGFSVTQASVSRDLEELGVVKIGGHYAQAPKPVNGPEYGTVTLATAGDNLIVGRCSSGLASAITVKIDAAGIPDIVGTIAGDDTIFVAVKDAAGQAAVILQIQEIFG
ncbi:arginine repressor [soil metagenome]